MSVFLPEDELLARRLQYQEDQRQEQEQHDPSTMNTSYPHHHHYPRGHPQHRQHYPNSQAAVAATAAALATAIATTRTRTTTATTSMPPGLGSSSAGSTKEQELRDMALARQIAQMDLLGVNTTTTNPSTNATIATNSTSSSGSGGSSNHGVGGDASRRHNNGMMINQPSPVVLGGGGGGGKHHHDQHRSVQTAAPATAQAENSHSARTALRTIGGPPTSTSSTTSIGPTTATATTAATTTKPPPPRPAVTPPPPSINGHGGALSSCSPEILAIGLGTPVRSPYPTRPSSLSSPFPSFSNTNPSNIIPTGGGGGGSGGSARPGGRGGGAGLHAGTGGGGSSRGNRRSFPSPSSTVNTIPLGGGGEPVPVSPNIIRLGDAVSNLTNLVLPPPPLPTPQSPSTPNAIRLRSRGIHNSPSSSSFQHPHASPLRPRPRRREQQQKQDGQWRQHQTDTDFKLARRIQVEELVGTVGTNGPSSSSTDVSAASSVSSDINNNNHSNSNDSDWELDNMNANDERLARLMAVTGRSLRDLSEEQLQDLYASMEEQVATMERPEPKHAEATPPRSMGERQISFVAPLRNDRHKLKQRNLHYLNENETTTRNNNNITNNNNSDKTRHYRHSSFSTFGSPMRTRGGGVITDSPVVSLSSHPSPSHSVSNSPSLGRHTLFSDNYTGNFQENPGYPSTAAAAAAATTTTRPKTPRKKAPPEERLAQKSPMKRNGSFPLSMIKANANRNGSSQQQQKAQPSQLPPAPLMFDQTYIPSAIPPRPLSSSSSSSSSSVCCAKCGLSDGTFLRAKDRLYHPECFRCAACHQKIDINSKFAFRAAPPPTSSNNKSSTNQQTLSSQRKQQQQQLLPYHAGCLPPDPRDICVVCKNLIPKGRNGMVCFVKHPFFVNERMCPGHAEGEAGRQSGTSNRTCRRCTGCHRFEPFDEPFADLDDAGRCVCLACCRTVVTDEKDVQPLWQLVIDFFEHKMKLPVWDDMRHIPVMLVCYEALNEQCAIQKDTTHSTHHYQQQQHQYRRYQTPPFQHHGGNNHRQIMTQGLCLTECQPSQPLKMPSLRFNWSNSSFEALDNDSQGFKYYDAELEDTYHLSSGGGGPRRNNNKVFAIMCLSGLPRDLTASILAHQATHAWFKLNPEYDGDHPLHPQVEGGIAQLVAMLFLNEGLEPLTPHDKDEYGTSGGPSDDELRQYFRFCIESDDHEIYGRGYQKAAQAYREVGIQPLMTHVVLNGTFPSTTTMTTPP